MKTIDYWESTAATPSEWRKILKDWNEEFPFLKRYGNSKLCYKTDIFLIGIDFDRYNGGYFPYFAMWGLWNVPEGTPEMFVRHNISRAIHNSHMPYYFHDRYFSKIKEGIAPLYRDVLNGSISYSSILNLSNFPYDPCAYMTIVSFNEIYIMLATYFKNDVLLAQGMEMLSRNLKKYETLVRKGKKSKDVVKSEEILKMLFEMKDRILTIAGNRELLMELCRKTSEKNNIRKLNLGVLVDDHPIPHDSLLSKIKRFFSFKNSSLDL